MADWEYGANGGRKLNPHEVNAHLERKIGSYTTLNKHWGDLDEHTSLPVYSSARLQMLSQDGASFSMGAATSYRVRIEPIYNELRDMLDASRFGGLHRPSELARALSLLHLAMCKSSTYEHRRGIEYALCRYGELADMGLALKAEYETCLAIMSQHESSFIDRIIPMHVPRSAYTLAKDILAQFTECEQESPEDMTGEAHLDYLRNWHRFTA